MKAEYKNWVPEGMIKGAAAGAASLAFCAASAALTASTRTFKKEIDQRGCIGSISELYDSKMPFEPKGAFAQAWSVAEVFRIIF